MTSASTLPPAPLELPGVETPRLGDRSLFPELEARAFLAHAAISPASRALTAATQACLADVTRLGVGSFPIWAAQRERLRSSAARLVRASEEQIALTAGCTKGITDLALALPWEEGDSLLCYEGEFPANVNPWQLAATARGARVELAHLPDPTQANAADSILSDLKQQLESASRPRWVAVSGVQFQTGLRMPLAEMVRLCHEHETRVFVDGIQGCGVVPWDLESLGVDAFFTGAHKWLLGLEGVGFAYFHADLMQELSPVTAGWLSYPDAEHFLFRGPGNLRYDRALRTTPRVFEGSTVSSIGYAAMEAGVDLLNFLTPAAIYEHVQKYHDAIEGELESLGLSSLRSPDSALRSTILSFRPPEGIGVPELAAALRQRGIVISIPDGLVRLAPHFSNSVDEVPDVVHAFREALGELRAL